MLDGGLCVLYIPQVESASATILLLTTGPAMPSICGPKLDAVTKPDSHWLSFVLLAHSSFRLATRRVATGVEWTMIQSDSPLLYGCVLPDALACLTLA